MGPTSVMGLFIVQLLFPTICVAIYILSQIILVVRTLDDRWPLGDITFGVFFYVAGLVLMFGFSAQICDGVKHYIDGTFFGVLCMLLSVMMVYKCELSLLIECCGRCLTLLFPAQTGTPSPKKTSNSRLAGASFARSSMALRTDTSNPAANKTSGRSRIRSLAQMLT